MFHASMLRPYVIDKFYMIQSVLVKLDEILGFDEDHVPILDTQVR